ncbi:MAG: PDZ domain-containing protein, partial [Candidatus Marinimicrobia bacterium]|nr:PDZ domain-containing protein [Candidatus Neomarinimicrobiota bacterium]
MDRAVIEREAELQREIALETYLKYSQRLHRVAYPILKNGASLFDEKVRPLIGFNYANKYSFPKDLRKASVSLFGLGERLQIISVTPGTPADDAGFQERDILVAINKQQVPVGLNAAQVMRKTLDGYTQSDRPLTISILRDSVLKEIDVRPAIICDYQVILGESNAINAYADGKTITITRGMLKLVDDDTELALVIGHELANNVMKHINAKIKNYAVGSIFDILAAMYGVDTGGA